VGIYVTTILSPASEQEDGEVFRETNVQYCKKSKLDTRINWSVEELKKCLHSLYTSIK
jgi:hypothetical protein